MGNGRAGSTGAEGSRGGGSLIPFDGSLHDWFEGPRLRCCLITLIDGAAKRRFSQFFEEETTAGVMTVLAYWIRTTVCGIMSSPGIG